MGPGAADNGEYHTIERMTALSKPDRGVRGIVTGNVKKVGGPNNGPAIHPARPLNPCRV